MGQSIGFIGSGVMGASIINHLLHAGHEVTVHTRTRSKAESLEAAGALWADTPKEAAAGKDLVFTMVGYPQDVEQVYFSEDGIFEAAESGQIYIDMTTSSPSLAERIYKRAEDVGISALDAPVSGGDVGARNGTLSIMCGGSRETFEKMLPVFETFGKNIVYQGKAGAGQHTKMCNQIAISTNMIGVCEALAYGKKAGLDLDVVLQSIEAGAAGSWSLSNLAPRMLKDNFEPGFYVKHFVKDMGIALEEAERMQLKLPGLELAKKLYDELVQEGYDSKGTQALYMHYVKQ